MDSTKIRRKSTGWNIQWKKTCGKTTTKMGRQHQEGLIVAAEYKGKKETSNRQGNLDEDYWKRGQGPMQVVASLKKKKNENMKVTK